LLVDYQIRGYGDKKRSPEGRLNDFMREREKDRKRDRKRKRKREREREYFSLLSFFVLEECPL